MVARWTTALSLTVLLLGVFIAQPSLGSPSPSPTASPDLAGQPGGDGGDGGAGGPGSNGGNGGAGGPGGAGKPAGNGGNGGGGGNGGPNGNGGNGGPGGAGGAGYGGASPGKAGNGGPGGNGGIGGNGGNGGNAGGPNANGGNGGNGGIGGVGGAGGMGGGGTGVPGAPGLPGPPISPDVGSDDHPGGNGGPGGVGGSYGGTAGQNGGNGGNGLGDPHFTGFDGSKYDFYGRSDAFFNMLSEKDHQINAAFTELFTTDGPHESGNFFTAFGLKFKSHKIEVAVDAATAELIVMVDDVSISLTDEETSYSNSWFSEGSSVSLYKYREDFGHSFELNTPLINVVIWSVPPHTSTFDGTALSAYLNFKVNLNSMPAGGHMAGVLGETFDNLVTPHIGDGTDGGATILNTQTELYEVSSLFADDFSGNLFGEATSSRRMRKLSEVTAPVAFPVLAEASWVVPAEQ